MNATDTQTLLTRQAENGVAPVDYGKLNVVYLALLGGVAAAARRPAAEPVTGREILPLAAATFALSKALSKEKVGTFVREPFVDHSTENGRTPRGHGTRAAIGELLTCTRCVGAWSAAAMVGLRVVSPGTGRTVATVLTVSAMNDTMQAGFNWLTARVDRESSR